MSQASFDFDPPPGDAPEREVTYSVRELVDAINGTLRARFGHGLWIRGEIQGCSERGAHAYFRLVEEGEQGRCVVNVSLFAPSRARLRPLLERHRLRLADGVKVRIHGHLDLYGPSGQLGLKMSGVDPRFTLGEMAIERDEVVRRLVAAGLYDANRARALTPVPLRVGLVTSRSSAAFADFVHEIERSGFRFQLQVLDVRVQGADAVPMITRAVRGLGRRDDIDVVVLVRGGGARTELATFDHEAVARAIVDCPVPVFTGLGHEIDRTIADDVAHSSFKTPTACAAGLAERVGAFVTSTEELWSLIGRRADHALERAARELDVMAGTARHRTVTALRRSGEHLGHQRARLRAGSERVLVRAEGRLSSSTDVVVRSPRRLDAESRHLEGLEAQVRMLYPVRTMARGWSITRAGDGRAVTDASTLSPGEQIVTTFARGSARSTVAQVDRPPSDPSDPSGPSDASAEERRR